MEIRRYRPEDNNQIVPLIAEYRVFLSSLKSVTKNPDFELASIELGEYMSSKYCIYVADDYRNILGYLVCRIDQDIVWAESLFVKESERRRGIGSALYAKAEQLVEKLGSETVYNWIHPNNDGIILFLKKRGYNVLNLVEIRRPWTGEKNFSTVQVGNYKFKY
ncbi:MAG: GNAT family N-acetyltransferase [Candidatus Thorarchaeota archaeon]|nr:GNAT family N-acetyltransferase [Candidatus Thorarchaeota archaeon]